jgi:hypothetical protein
VSAARVGAQRERVKMKRFRVTAARVLAIAGVCGLMLVSGVSTASAATTGLTASGSGSSEVPAGSASDTVAATVDVDPAAGTITYTVSFQGSEPVVAGHIHKGAVGVSGPVVVMFDAAVINAHGTATVKVDKVLAAAIVADPAGYYVNVHTKSHLSGAARGQLMAGSGTAPTAVNAGSGGQFAAAQSGLGGPMAALVIGSVVVLVAAAGVYTVRKRSI